MLEGPDRFKQLPGYLEPVNVKAIVSVQTAFVCVFLLLAGKVFAQDISLQSGPQKTIMIELFTSQGCNSCPPAEEYLNTFVEHPKLWDTFIPIAFHVDYWDYLGWKDRFANPAHAKRQQQYAQLRRVRTVYTPAFVVNGKAWGVGFFRSEPQVDTPSVGNLTVVIDDQRISATFDPQHSLTEALYFNVAVLGMNLSTSIRAGENRGRDSHHEFVVLGRSQVRGADNQWHTTFPEIKQTPTGRFALVAWVSGSGDPTPIQATGGYIPAAMLKQ